MATSKLHRRKRGARVDNLTPNQQKFVMELLASADWNITAAVRKAYPNCKNPSAYAVKLMDNHKIKAILGKVINEDMERLELKREEVLLQLWYCLTRSATDFIDEDGSLRDIHDMGRRAQGCIDGIDIDEFIDSETGEITKRKTKLRLVPKASAIDMAMKHLGLNAPEQHEHVIGSVQQALDRLSAPPPIDEVAKVLEEEEQKLLKGDG